MFSEATLLLQRLVETPSFSKEENETADILFAYLSAKGFEPARYGNNVVVSNDKKGPFTVLLNTHHDTVKPNGKWEVDPFEGKLTNTMLIGLGSNDAGASVVSMLQTFLDIANEVPYKLILALTAEEEISGQNGIASIIPIIGNIDLSIVGEPTQMNMAIAEKGLVVIDATARGKSGHAARKEGINSIYLALEDIQKLQHYKFIKESPMLGEVNVAVTQIEAGTQHNVVPGQCKFVIDLRTTEAYTNEEAVQELQHVCTSELRPRSLRLQSSGISKTHPIVQEGNKLGMTSYGSPTLSDQALMPFTSIKIGPGDSARSHTPNEFILLSEIEDGIEKYKQLLKALGNYETLG